MEFKVNDGYDIILRSTIIVALKDLISFDNSVIKEGEVVEAIITGGYSRMKENWVVGLKDRKVGDSDYYSTKVGNFRPATDKEMARYKILGRYKLAQLKYKVNDKLISLSEISPIEKGNYIPAETEVIIENIIENGENPDRSIMWFKDTPGVFRMSDNFELHEKK